MVAEFVQSILTKRVMFPSNLADHIRRRIGGTKRVFERVRLFASRKELHLYGQFHTNILLQVLKYGEAMKRRVILRPLNGVASL